MAGVSVVLVAVLVGEVAPWSDENLATEGSSWNYSGFGCSSVVFMEASNSCLVFWFSGCDGERE